MLVVGSLQCMHQCSTVGGYYCAACMTAMLVYTYSALYYTSAPTAALYTHAVAVSATTAQRFSAAVVVRIYTHAHAIIAAHSAMLLGGACC